MKTYAPRPRDVRRRWYVLDGNGAVLGRLASEAAKLLRGKHKPIFAPHADVGDHVIVVNARGIVLTGGKEEKKVYYRHSGYPGGIRATEYTRLLAERPVLAVEKAIRGMLPKNRLGRQMFRKLAVYDGAEHPHEAQKPIGLGLGEVPKWEGLPPPEPAVPPEREPASRTRAGTSRRRGAGQSAATQRKPSGRGRSAAARSTKAASPGTKTASRAKASSGRAAPAGGPARRARKSESSAKTEES